MKNYKEEVESLLSLIRDKRKELGITQTEMAEFIGTNQNSYKNIETGQIALKFDVLLKILDKLKIDIFKTFNNEEEESLMTVPTSEEFIKSYFEQKGNIEELKNKTDKIENQNTEILYLLKKMMSNED